MSHITNNDINSKVALCGLIRSLPFSGKKESMIHALNNIVYGEVHPSSKTITKTLAFFFIKEGGSGEIRAWAFSA